MGLILPPVNYFAGGSGVEMSRTFVIDELEGFRVEFHLGPDGEVDELFFHQPMERSWLGGRWVAASH